MKIANITIEGRWGGPQKRILQVAKKLQQNHNIKTIIIFPLGPDSELFKKKIKATQINFVQIALSKPQKNLFNIIKYFASFLIETIKLAQILKREKIDIVHCNGAWQLQGILAAFLARKKVVWFLNDTRDSFLKYIVQLFYPFISVIAFSAERVKRIYLPASKQNSPKLFLLRPPVDTEYYRPTGNNQTNNHSEITIGTLGNINAFKGLELFLAIAEKSPSNTKVIIGGPIYQSQKKYGQKIFDQINQLQQTGRDIKYIGNVKNPIDFYRQINIFVCASTSESGPMTVFEAMSMGIPIITSDVGDLKQIIQNGEQGYVVGTRNATDYSKIVDKLVQNPDLRYSMGQKARAKIIEICDVKKIAAKHKIMYNQIIESK